MNPSHFTSQPWSSIFNKSEAEWVIQNIMIILKRIGDVWRELSEEEYVIERKKDGGFTNSELSFFHEVLPYTINAVKASRVSKEWAKIYDENNITV